MPNEEANSSIRDFLREYEGLLVHFSTPMGRDDLLFPNDLRNALALTNVPLSFSTIQANDIGPHQKQGMQPADANAGGSIGIIVDIPSEGCVITVGPNDDGTSHNPETGEIISGGFAPTSENCARSINDRKSSNEWLVRDFHPIALFAFLPIRARQRFADELIVEVPIDRDVALGFFPEYRIFSVLQGRFVEFDRATGNWIAVSYDTIMSATPAENGVVGERALSEVDRATKTPISSK